MLLLPSSVRRPSIIFKDLLLRDRYLSMPNVCGISMGSEMEACLRNLGHISKMAALCIYGKTPLNFFFSGISGPISTKLGI